MKMTDAITTSTMSPIPEYWDAFNWIVISPREHIEMDFKIYDYIDNKRKDLRTPKESKLAAYMQKYWMHIGD